MIWLAPVVPVAVWLLFWAGEETVVWWRRRRRAALAADLDRHAQIALSNVTPSCECRRCRRGEIRFICPERDR